jgi:hypothetical protein
LGENFQVADGQPVVLHMGWLAKTRSQAKSFADMAEITLIIDNNEYTGLLEYWGKLIPFSNGYGIEWNLPLTNLSLGVHRIEYSLSLADRVTDGFDFDKNGKLDQYGPGEALSGWVEIDVHK